MTNFLRMYVIYDHPSDYPDRFVARRAFVGAVTVCFEDDVLAADSLDNLRKMLPQGLICIPRGVNDDPVIVEAWI